MYEDIREQITNKAGKEEKQQILIVGNFNSKIGAAIESNKIQVTEAATETSK